MSEDPRPPELLEHAGTKLLFTMAAQAEYGEHLQARFAPLMTGVGPVEAAMAVSGFLGEATARGARPDLVVCLGSAGSAKLDQAQVYQATSVGYRDMDASALGFEKGATPFLDLPAVLEIGAQIPGVPAATLSTGANVVSGEAYNAIDADMVDMETYAVLRACQAHGVAMIGLRGISDGREELNAIDDWTRLLHVIDEHLAQAVDATLEAISSGAMRI